MATTKKAAETAAVDYSTMNVFKKLQLARVRFLEAGVDKSGKHMKLEYKYFELADIVPKADDGSVHVRRQSDRSCLQCR